MKTLDEFLRAQGIVHFTAAETRQLLRLGVTAPEPPAHVWQNIVGALQLAEEMRALLGHPLIIANGYRPWRLNILADGAPNSQHIHYRALDLQLPKGYCGVKARREDLVIAAELVFAEFADWPIGLGVYGRDRVHIDVGFRRRRWG